MLWRTPRPRGTKATHLLALLPLATLANAVSLSDFTPRLSDLPPACNDAYFTTIPGCTVADFSNSRNTCTRACLNGLVRINALVSTACADADVEETSIVGLFKLGKAIQLLCNVAVVTTTTGLTNGGGVGGGGPTVSMSMTRTASIGQSTMMLSSTAPVTSGIVTDTSMPVKPSNTVVTSARQSATSPITTSLPASSNGIIVDTSSKASGTETAATSKTTLSPDAAQSQRSGNVGSGGGSPFDNINNSSAVSIRSASGMIGSTLAAILLGAYLSLG